VRVEAVPSINILDLLVISIFQLPSDIGIPLFYLLILCASVIPGGIIGTVIGYYVFLPPNLKSKKSFFNLFSLSFLLNSIVWFGLLTIAFPLLPENGQKPNILVFCYMYMQPVFFITAIIISYKKKKSSFKN
jgi:hypothetical protein